MKKIVGSLCVLIYTTCFAQPPNAKVLVLEKEQGEKRVRPAGVGIATLPVEFTLILDGPYADSKEQLGGFHIIDVADLDAAIAWAARFATALHGVVEVRPVREATLLTRDVADYLAE